MFSNMAVAMVRRQRDHVAREIFAAVNPRHGTRQIFVHAGCSPDRLRARGWIGIVAMLVQATGAPAFSAACSGASAGSQWMARKRGPVTFPAASEMSQTSDGAITSGWIIVARAKPASSEIIGVLVIPAGTRTLTVTPLPSRSFAIIAMSASSMAIGRGASVQHRVKAGRDIDDPAPALTVADLLTIHAHLTADVAADEIIGAAPAGFGRIAEMFCSVSREIAFSVSLVRSQTLYRIPVIVPASLVLRT